MTTKWQQQHAETAVRRAKKKDGLATGGPHVIFFWIKASCQSVWVKIPKMPIDSKKCR